MTCRIYFNGKLAEFPTLPNGSREQFERQARMNAIMRKGVEFDMLFQWIPFHFGQYMATCGKAIQGVDYDYARKAFSNQELAHAYGRWWALTLVKSTYMVHDGGRVPRRPGTAR